MYNIYLYIVTLRDGKLKKKVTECVYCAVLARVLNIIKVSFYGGYKQLIVSGKIILVHSGLSVVYNYTE